MLFKDEIAKQEFEKHRAKFLNRKIIKLQKSKVGKRNLSAEKKAFDSINVIILAKKFLKKFKILQNRKTFRKQFISSKRRKERITYQ